MQPGPPRGRHAREVHRADPHSIQISKGVPITAVRGWLGHASIALTVDLYGNWLPTEAEVVEILPVAFGASTGNRAEDLARASA